MICNSMCLSYFIPGTTRSGDLLVLLEVAGVDGRAGGDAAITSWAVEASLHGESANESIVDSASETKSLYNVC